MTFTMIFHTYTLIENIQIDNSTRKAFCVDNDSKPVFGWFGHRQNYMCAM